MFRDPDIVIQETVENLRLLAEFFSDEIDTLLLDREQTPALHCCREARSAIVALVPKLRAAREVQEPQYAATQRPYCWNCD
jgi:hypothetical protein